MGFVKTNNTDKGSEVSCGLLYAYDAPPLCAFVIYTFLRWLLVPIAGGNGGLFGSAARDEQRTRLVCSEASLLPTTY